MEAVTIANPFTAIQKTQHRRRRKLKAYLVAQVLDEAMTVVLDCYSGKILAIAPVSP